MTSKTALVFAGQGAQYVGMGKELAERHPSARAWFDRARSILGYDVGTLCFQGPEPELTRTEHAQPAIFLVGWVAFEVLLEQVPALTFEAAAGLSLGEFTALAAAGAMSFDAALRVVRQRGQFMQDACERTRGGMSAVIGLDEAATRQVCDEAGVQIANLNCPGQIVISGELGRIETAGKLARARGAKRVLPLPVAGAYHSSLMAGAQRRLREVLAGVDLRTPRVAVVANVTAQPHGGPEDIRARLAEQVTAAVRWEDSMRRLLAEGFTRFVELGPGTALTGFLKRIGGQAQLLNVQDGASLEATVRALST
jgi:[acyl-carrier-protein] S-malonyltransferase